MSSPSPEVSFDKDQIRTQLQRVLSSSGFRRAEALTRFLTYAVEETLAGRGAQLKEYSIGTAVFRRGKDFDPRIDPIVRVQARNVRARLDDYNATTGARDTFVIEFARGSYNPVFRVRAPKTEPPPSVAIAVLPFTRLTEQPDDYFLNGLTEELIGALSRVAGLQVAARTSVFAFRSATRDIREIGGLLGVAFLLEGSVRQSEDRLRVSVQLIEVATGLLRWSDAMELGMAEMLDMQQRIADSVCRQLPLATQDRSTPAPGHIPDLARRIQAHELYLKARYQWSLRTREGFMTSLALFKASVETDPTFAPSWSGQADCMCLMMIYGVVSAKDVISAARYLALKAVEIDPRSAEAHTVLGKIAAFYDWHHDEAHDRFVKAIELSPSYADAHQWYASLHLCTLGRLNEAIAAVEAALRCDPLSTTLPADLAQTLSLAGRHEEGLEMCQRLIERELAAGREWFRSYWVLGLIYERMGAFGNAISALERCRTLSAGEAFESTAIGSLGHTYAVSGRHADAEACLAALGTLSIGHLSNSLSYGLIYTGLRNLEQAFLWFNKAADERTGPMLWLAVDPRNAPLIDDDRYMKLLARLGLAEPQQAEPQQNDLP